MAMAEFAHRDEIEASSDEELFAQARDHNEQSAYRELMQRMHVRALGFLYTMRFQDADIADILQQSWLKLLGNMHAFKEESSFATWFMTIVKNEAYDHLRSHNVKFARKGIGGDSEYQDLAESVPDETMQTPLEYVLTKERDEILWRTFNDVPEKGRSLLTKVYVQGLLNREVAREDLVPIGTVKSGLFAARKRLHDLLEKQKIADYV